MFKEVREGKITEAIVREFRAWFEQYINTDVIVVGGGPSGLMAAREVAKEGYRVLLIESNNYLGGGFWIGGYLLNTLTFRDPAQGILDELGIPYKKYDDNLFTADAPSACAKLISSACDVGVKVLNMTKFEDVIYKGGKVKGVVVNWSPVSALPPQFTCVDPIALESKVVIDATGHDACVCESLAKRKIIELSDFGPMDVNLSEELIVEKTGPVCPGLIVCGMAVATLYGLPRMGPTFGAMLFSGRKAGEEAKRILKSEKRPVEEVVSF